MKIYRFIREYENYVKKSIEHNELMNPGIKAEILRRVDDTLKLCEEGIITINETMAELSRDCMRDGEDMGKYIIA